ncbi:MAG: efflux RND transporter periplasmic adaptor subunit, partial [Caldimonas sp.]
MSDIDPTLLSQLRIDGQERESEGSGGRRWLWPAAAGVLVVAALGATAWWFLAARPIPVQTTSAVAAGGSAAASGAVLQATGYITARRQATVSTQITGTLTQVLIEEGVHVEKGQVIARL